MGRYSSPLHAVADQLAALISLLRTQRLVFPHRCTACGRTTRQVPASRPVTARGVPCRRRTWRLRPCDGNLVKAT